MKRLTLIIALALAACHPTTPPRAAISRHAPAARTAAAAAPDDETRRLRDQVRRAAAVLNERPDKRDSRVYFDLDPTNKRPDDPARRIEKIPGYRGAFVVKNAHLNNLGKPAGANHEDPPTDSGIRECAKAAKAANLPLVWDIEHTKSLNFYDGAKGGQGHFEPTLEQRRAALRHWLRVAKISREVLGPDHTVLIYHYPQSSPTRIPGNDWKPHPALAAEERELCDLLTGPCYEFYDWGVQNGEAVASSWWWKNREENEASLARDFPDMAGKRGLVIVHPFWAGTERPLPMWVWKFQGERLLSASSPWHDVMVWVGTAPFEPVEEHVRWAAGKAGVGGN